MQIKLRRVASLGSAGALLAAAACKQDLNVTNPNQPDATRAVYDAGDVKKLVGDGWNSWLVGEQQVNPTITLAVLADQSTNSWNNFNANYMGQEAPTGGRRPYDNSPAALTDAINNAQLPWNRAFALLGSMNDAIGAVGIRHLSLGADSARYMTLARLLRGNAIARLALFFDKAGVTNENYNPLTDPKPPVLGYVVLRDSALAMFNAAIAGSAGATWTFTDSPDITTASYKLDAKTFNALANTLAARLIAYTPRDAAENAAANWARVLAYANKGISTVANPQPLQFTGTGDATKWYDESKEYLEDQDWNRVDYSIIKMMDPSQPSEYTACTDRPAATSSDKRLTTDFSYVDYNVFRTSRGCYFFSNYTHTRYVYTAFDYSDAPGTGDVPIILPAENDLLIAEAEVRTGGNRVRAATLINNTRVNRGGLPALTGAESTNALLDAIFYERNVELMNTGSGLPWYDRRRVNGPPLSGQPQQGLQPGSPRHFPIPAQDLLAIGMPLYTFGGFAPYPEVHPEK
jgi:hypothetical protein